MSSSTLPTKPPLSLPERLDHLPWSSWHLRLVFALGVAWLLDGLEGSLAGSLAGALQSAAGLGLSEAELGISSSFYLAGAVLGSLLFGFLADKYGRKRLFLVTLGLYVTSATLTAGSWNLFSFTLCRFFTGAGIGGEYAAINSAVDELIPARLRGQVNLAINGTFWLGIILGSLASGVLLSRPGLSPRISWRLAYLFGFPIGLLVLYLRRHIPESPRWLVAHGRTQEAAQIISALENATEPSFEEFTPVSQRSVDCVSELRGETNLRSLFRIVSRYRVRALVCFALMTAQAFLYNSIFFSLTLVLLRYDHVSPGRVGYAFLPIALANFLGPVLLGRASDRLGRRPVIAGTYMLSGILLVGDGILLLHPSVGLVTHIAAWSIVFIFASTAASSAYLTVSELFPQEMRALAIAVFYAFGTLLGGVSGPLIFGRIVGSGSRLQLFLGYLVGAVLMVIAGGIQARWGVRAEGRSLESLREV